MLVRGSTVIVRQPSPSIGPADQASETPMWVLSNPREIPVTTSAHPLGGLSSATGSPSQLHLSGRSARTCAAIAGDTPASLTTPHPYPRTTCEEPQEQFRGASSIAGRNFTPVRQPVIPMSDGSLEPAPQLMTLHYYGGGILKPQPPEHWTEAPCERMPEWYLRTSRYRLITIYRALILINVNKADLRHPHELAKDSTRSVHGTEEDEM